MKKIEKLKRVSGLVWNLGLSVKDVAEYFLAMVCDTPENIRPGMYVYAGGLIYPEIIPGRQIMAIVGYVEGSVVYAVCLRTNRLQWSSDRLHVSTWNTENGAEATRRILDAARQDRCEAEAAKWCQEYAEDGVEQGEAFLPSKNELRKLYPQREAINASLKTLGCPLLQGWMFSSTSYLETSEFINAFCMDTGRECAYGKTVSENVRPIIKVQI